ncbi:class I adenylate-forming enzyme family protein [Nocardioides sambongensis]|uniref:class I adenylate-forming enzyme family protein n=1 Tax=Nocardioides sambongensis TaxID=2589074 RepID=UPI00112D8525|nr:AMP-binding protein [Nocardioides sambongensis]
MSVDQPSLVDAWRARVDRDPTEVALTYFDGRLTAEQLDSHADALAAALQERGVGKGDRVGLYLQNVPAYPLALLALWRIGAAAVLLNPMYRGEELRRILDDSGASGIVCGAPLATEARAVADGRWLITAADTDFQTRNDERVLSAAEGDLRGLLEEHQGSTPTSVEVRADDLALLTYTSGTTGPPKGAMNTHANLLAVIDSYGEAVELSERDVVLAIAPLFHITGVVINATIALVHGAPLVLTHRFHPEVVLEACAEHGVTFTIGSITAFNSLAQSAGDDASAFASSRALYSGGAPIPPSTVERFEERYGLYVHNVYGMTETSSAVIAVPLGERAPVDEASGTLSVGKPLSGLTVRTLGADGEETVPGEQGELEICGPQVVPGYWRNEEATRQTMPGGRLRTGDVAVIDADGWVYLVDRLKDQINVSGYKVWPREVEDALVSHDAVLEAAVVGRPDDYQGESVVAYVALRDGTTAEPDEVRAHVKARLAAYKVPREVHVVEELPKTQTGKIRRNALRDGDDVRG